MRAGALLWRIAFWMLGGLTLPARTESLRVEAVSLSGELPVTERQARRALALSPGDAFSPEAAQAASDRLLREIRLQAYPLARLRWRGLPTAAGEGVALEFISEPGPFGKLEELSVAGNLALTSDRLLANLKVRPRSGAWNRFSGADLLWVEELGADQEQLLHEYREEGYWDAEIGSPDLSWRGEGRGFRLQWTVLSEGPQYRVGEIRLVGDVAPLADWPLPLRHGDIARPARLRGAADALREFLLERGHGFSSVEVETEWQAASGSVDLRFVVKTGRVPVLREIQFRGNHFTRDAVLLREIPLRPGEPFHARALRVGEESLARLGVFEKVELQYIGHPEDEEFDLLVDLREAPSGRAEAGLSWGSVEGPAFLVRLLDRNLSLRPPYRGNLLFGELTQTLGSEILRTEAGLRNPRLGESLWGLGGRVYWEDNRYISDLYDQEVLGFSLVADYPLTLRQRLGVGVGYTFYDLDNLDPRLDAETFSEERELDLSALLFSWDYLGINQTFRPSRGLRLRQDVRLGVPWLGGDTEVLESVTRGAVYTAPVPGWVLSFRGGMNQIESSGGEEVPLPLRVYLGGPQDLRGFDYRSVSTRGDTGLSTGSAATWWGGTELWVPASSRLDVALYVEGGDTAAEAWSFDGEGWVSNWGLGLLIRAENFPVRFDVAFPLEVRPDDSDNRRGEARFSFSAAYVF